MEKNLFLEEKKQAIGLIHKVYLTNLKNKKKYTASTKTRAEVRGGGKKPWKQKGTGNARAGSNRSPLWVGGGCIFGPKPKVSNKKINKKENRLALSSALFLKKRHLIFVEENKKVNKTKDLKSCLQTWIQFSNQPTEIKKKGTSVLIILQNYNSSFWRASRNLRNTEISTLSCLNVTSLLKADQIIFSF